MKNHSLLQLAEVGQSIWYDNVSRKVLEDGTLASLIESGVTGLTSNPAIFKKAIADSTDYDEALRDYYNKGTTDPDELCEKLIIDDVAAAADLLRPVFDATDGADGFASIEVSPKLAANTDGTVEAARRIWGALDRPNIMIKIPATPEGIPAIAQALSEGIHVNVTLIFSPVMYEKVVDAYCQGLEERHKQGAPISAMQSVASFFVSRVDALCEKELDTLVEKGELSREDADNFIGKIGIANSKAAYKIYLDRLASERFGTLKELGASLQRPLWASTSTKNPSLPELLYVKELAGRGTVNTLPPATLDALMSDSGTYSAEVESGLDEAESLITQLAKTPLDLSELLDSLLRAGVQSFADAYEELIDAIRQKSLEIK